MTLVIAHRGASGLAPENTLEAFHIAYESGADAIEFDVHLTKDAVPVVIHDETINRTTNGKGFVQDYTSEELKAFNASNRFKNTYPYTSIPSLEEVLQWAEAKNIILNIELKTNKIQYKQIEQIVYHLVSKYSLLERTIFSSFSVESLVKLKKIDTQIKIAYITSKFIDEINLDRLKQEANIYAVHFKYTLFNNTWSQILDRANLRKRVFTVNKQRLIQKCSHYQVDGIITDFPEKTKNILIKH